MDESDILQQVAGDLATAMRTGAVAPDDPPGAMQMVVDLLVYAYPDIPRPQTLDPFSMIAGAAFALGCERFQRE